MSEFLFLLPILLKNVSLRVTQWWLVSATTLSDIFLIIKTNRNANQAYGVSVYPIEALFGGGILYATYTFCQQTNQLSSYNASKAGGVNLSS